MCILREQYYGVYGLITSDCIRRLQSTLLPLVAASSMLHAECLAPPEEVKSSNYALVDLALDPSPLTMCPGI